MRRRLRPSLVMRPHLRSHHSGERTPGLGFTFEDSERVVGKPYLTALWKGCPSSGNNRQGAREWPHLQLPNYPFKSDIIR
jgi:hypothetical protein